MQKVPSLFSLCTEAITTTITHGYHNVEDILELPSYLLDSILMNLPPLALQNIHELSDCDYGRREFATNNIDAGRKRGRFDDTMYESFNTAWKVLFKKRWPDYKEEVLPVCEKIHDGMQKCKLVNHTIDWQQLYWEAHLQNCLNEAAERALLPSFDGHIGELAVPDSIMKLIGQNGSKAADYSKLSYQGNKFGCYARCLRLQSVLCVPETSALLKCSKLQSLMFRRVTSEIHVNGLCMLLNQNKETLSSLEFIHCRLSSVSMDQICSCLYQEGTQSHGIQLFSIKSSFMFENKSSSMPAGLLSFISSGRFLHSLCFCDCHMEAKHAKMVFDTIRESSCALATLEISDNNIAGWLCKVDRKHADLSILLGSAVPLKSLAVLNLRGNNLCKDDAEDLSHVLVHLPKLRSLDISDNPFFDDGIRSLIPYFINALEKAYPLSDLKIENCSVSCTGFSELVSSLPTPKNPINTLSIADNHLGSSVAPSLAKILGMSCVRVLNIEEIGLGSLGFKELEEKLPQELPLVSINVSKNRGGIEAAHFISKVILHSPNIVSIDAAYNFMPTESVELIHDALVQGTGKLERLNLTGNTYLSHSVTSSKLLDFHYRGKPIVTVPSNLGACTPYDDDP